MFLQGMKKCLMAVGTTAICLALLAFGVPSFASAASHIDSGKWYTGTNAFHGKVSDGNYNVAWDHTTINMY